MPTKTNSKKRKADNAMPSTVKPLAQLSNAKVHAVTNLTDTLNMMGLKRDLDIPSTVVVGDTSSGKSSVMSRLTGLPFPSGSGIKTIFVTEVAMKPHDSERITFQVLPGNAGSAGCAKTLQRVQDISIDDFTLAYEQAAAEMKHRSKRSQTLFDDVLRIEMWGPDCPPLTVIDLPGLMHSSNRKVSKEDVGLSAQLIDRYISKSRTLILAVVSASNLAVNQAITEMAAHADPEKKRTMGILTKLDTIKDEDREEDLIRTLRNKEVVLKLGWHGLINVIQGKKDASSARVDAAEMEFFAQSCFKKIDSDHTGIDAFRTRVTNVHGHAMINAIPDMEAEAKRILHESELELVDLGAPRIDIHQQRQFLRDVCKIFEEILKFELDTFEASLPPRRSLRVRPTKSEPKLRKGIDSLQYDFTQAMRCYGSSINFVDPNAHENLDKSNVYADWAFQCTPKQDREAIAWVLENQKQCRDTAFPGTMNNHVASQMFRALSSRWEKLTAQHIRRVEDKCVHEMNDMLSHATGKASDAVSRITKHWIKTHVKGNVDEGLETAKQILKDTPKVLSSSDPNIEDRAAVHYAAMASNHGSLQQLGLGHILAIGALAGVRAYYENELEHWLKSVSDRVVHRLVRSLKKAVTCDRAEEASDEEVARLVAEPQHSIEKRMELEEKIDRLQNALGEIEQHKKNDE